MTELRTCHLLQSLAHHLHAEYQEGDGAQEFQGNKHMQVLCYKDTSRTRFAQGKKAIVTEF